MPEDPGYIRLVKVGPQNPNFTGHVSARMVKKIIIKDTAFNRITSYNVCYTKLLRRLFLEPLLQYIDDILSNRQPNEAITIVVPHFVPEQKVHNVLHMQTAEMLRRELLSTPGVVITEVPYQIP